MLGQHLSRGRDEPAQEPDLLRTQCPVRAPRNFLHYDSRTTLASLRQQPYHMYSLRPCSSGGNSP